MLHNLSSPHEPTSEEETTIQISIMFSLLLFRSSKFNICLILFFFFSYFYHLPLARSEQERRVCDTLFQCGNLTAGFPFWGMARPQPCGHPSLGLQCNRQSNSTSLIISGLMYRVLQVNITTSTLKLVRQDLTGPFCSASFSGATLTPELFHLLSDYKILSSYFLCNNRFHYHANFTCPSTGIGSMYQNDTYHKYCGGSVNITVPIGYTPEKEALNVTKLESVLKEGFEVKLRIDEKPCQECKSAGGICVYDVATPVCCKGNSTSEINCNPLVSLGEYQAKQKFFIGITVTGGFVVLVAIGLIIYKVMSFGLQRRKASHHREPNLKGLLQLKQYSYAQVKKITKSFSHTVGKGGFGTVYGGDLCDGRKVAVKILKDIKSSGEDFINEVASMSQTSHVNIVSLLGFCYEGSKRAIVYEFLENGSLDQFISSKKSLNLSVDTLYGIALGVARGLEYLHYSCKTRIVHFDIKPQNVLLDNNLCPKISDFGLARLCEKRESILSLLDTRGTIGYIAPEVFSRVYGRVSHKSDVYSYGMLVLEMIGAKHKEPTASNSSSAYFPDWIYKDLENGQHTWRYGDEITREENETAKKMTLVGLWCIQPCPSNRPPMNRVVEMMEGSLDAIEVPPKPSFHFSSMPLPESSSLSEENSI